MRTVIIIPARLESSRLQRKLLLAATGHSLIEHTYRAASASRLADEVIVATDSADIQSVVQQFGGEAIMTAADHRSGTDRVAEAAATLDADLIVNVQGDEPEIDASAIDRLIDVMLSREDADVGTLATSIRDPETLCNPNCVKVVFDRSQRALYFSRSPIPYLRCEGGWDRYFRRESEFADPIFFQHIGVYAYRREVLQRIPNLAPSAAERAESLEQLRFLDHQLTIVIEVVDHNSAGIDTAEDYQLFVNRWNNR